MNKIKKKFSLAQRYHLARLFKSDLSEHGIYGAMGSTMKSYLMDAITLYWVPRLKVQEYPPMEVGDVVEKDADGNITKEEYQFEMVLPVPAVIGMELKFTRSIKKNSLDTIV